MLEMAVIQGVFKLIMGLLALMSARLGLIWMDRAIINGSEFGQRLNSWGDHAQALYYSGRLVAVALVIGLALS